ncbi:MAG TPA: ferric reductase-like transmembrane domain-containing protein [Pelolinea sp.]|nr:ferric reductase-like transmembrane domain-containing protein [Pelolinea sp.]
MITKSRFWGALYIVLYAILILLPIIILLLGPKFRDRPTLLDLSVSFAFIGLAIMALQFISSARLKELNKPFGIDLVYHFHRQTGIASFLLVFSHPILLFILDSRYLRLLNIFTAPLRAQMGMGAILLLIGVVWMAEWRQKLKIPYWFWKIWHGILASVMIPMALVHILLAGNYIDLPWKRAFWIGYSILFTLTLVYTRIVYPLRLINRPFEVKEIKEERGSVWTVIMEPFMHNGFSFLPGQFGWLTAWRTPFSDTEHPFSLASSAERKDSVEMSIKNLGPYTARIQTLKPGDKVFIDAPYGYFSIDRYPDAEKLVLISGGIGITPVISMMRTLADRGDKRPITLFYCNQEWETVTFREEIEELSKQLNLKVIYVIERPPENWQGESGFLNAAILDKYLDKEWKTKNSEVFLCGPPPMMSAVEKALIKVGYDERHVHSEEFALV